MDERRLNGSGCIDDTAYEAIKNLSPKVGVMRYNYTNRDKEAEELVHAIKKLTKACGFRLIDRIKFEDPKTGKKYV